MKRIIKALTITAILLVVATCGGAIYLINYALTPVQRSRNEVIDRVKDDYPALRGWIDSLVTTSALRDTIITLPDGTQRHGYYVTASSPTTHTALLVHGYSCSGLKMLHVGYIYHHSLGYNILLPDLWAHGESEGDHIGMGWRERHEVIEWARVASEMWSNGSTPSSVVMHGVSMGAATVMNASGEQLPPCVKAIVEDCGYTSAWDEFEYQLHEDFGLPAFPVLYASSALCKMKYGWSFGENSPVNQVTKSKLPMLFIHGDADTFVPTAMVHEVYAAHPGPKQLWIAPGSAHDRSYMDHPQEYTAQLKQFLNIHNKP